MQLEKVAETSKDVATNLENDGGDEMKRRNNVLQYQLTKPQICNKSIKHNSIV